MMYHGFAISDSTAISFWNTGLMPISSLAYSALGGMVLSLNLNPAAGATGARYLPPAHSASLVLLVAAAIIVLALLQGAKRGSPGAKKSLFLLTREGPYVKWFYGLVMGAGFVLPFLLLAFLPESRVVSFLVAVAVLSGYYAFRVLVFKVGLYDPIISFAPES
jgi:formate-dependent nitrite reductase membrane component NrfD